MGRVLETLWDLLGLAPAAKEPAPSAPTRRPDAGRKPAPKRRAAPNRTASLAATIAPARTVSNAGSMQAKYDAMVESKLREHGVRVRKWRSGMSGIAWQVEYRDGRVVRLIESPRPKGPMSAAVFLHEIGHHAIGFNVYKPRCLEEYHAWAYAIREMEALGLNVTEGVRKRMHDSLKYAVDKARRRGLRVLPRELEPYQDRWPGSKGSNGN